MNRNVVGGNFIKRGLFIFLVFSIGILCYGQRYLIHHYSEENGLLSAEVYDICQDHTGRMWFATRAGISCYDGTSWKSYTTSNGLPALSFIKIAVDHEGQVWALSDLAKYSEIHTIFFDGSKWNSIDKLEIANPAKNQITSFHLLQGNTGAAVAIGSGKSGLFLWRDGKWKRFTTGNGLSSNAVKGIAGCDGKYYAATGGGVVELKADGTLDDRLNRVLALPGREITGICAERKDKYRGFELKESRIWLYGHRWLGYFNSGSETFVPVKTGVFFTNKTAPVKLLPDYRGGLYMGNENEVFYFNYKTGESELLRTQSGLISEGAYSMFVDFERNVWITSARGVSKITGRRFANFQKSHGLLEDEVTAIVEYAPGKFVFGHNRGITFREGQSFAPILFTKQDGSPYPFCRVLDMKTDSQNNVWLIAEGVGLGRIDRQKRIKWYGKEQGLEGYLMTLWVDEDDRIYVASDTGIFIRQGNRFSALTSGKYPKIKTRKIYITPRKEFCLASIYSGLYTFRNNRWSNFQTAVEKRENNIYAMYEDRRGRLWLGTLGGLVIRREERLEKYKKNGFEINRPVYFITEDPDGNLWFGTDNGVVRWDGSREIRYSTAEGLVGQETNRAAGIVDSRGRVWIGTNLGVSVYNKQFDSYLSRQPPPKLYLVDASVDGRKVSLNQPLKLNHDVHNIIFYFRGISFMDEKAIRFKHKLEGFDRDWLAEHFSHDQSVRYSSLPPGKYRFYLKVKNSVGVWSEPVISPELVVLKPFYFQWWFFILSFAAATSLLYVVFRFFTQQRYAVLLKKQVEEQTFRLHTAEKKYTRLFEEAKDVVFISTPGGEIVDINPAGVELFGFESKDEILQGTTTAELYFRPGDRLGFRKAIEKKGYVKDYESVLKTKDGDKITALITATLVRNNEGHIVAYRGTIRDISDKKRLEQQLMQSQKMEAIGTLAGGIAHDFNNLLGVIMGNTEMMLDDLPEGTEMHRTAKQVALAAKRASELVKQILAFSRQTEQERRPLKIGGIIKEAMKLLRASLPATVEIRHSLDVESDMVLADVVQIHQVMMNLCANAAFAMQEKGGILKVSLENVYLDVGTVKRYDNLKPGNYLRLTVSDTGRGIPANVMKRVFEPYFTTKKTGEGTGMGLAVVHGIVRSHEGDITVYSETGKGATFQVFLPLIEETAGSKTGEIEKPAGGSERILFVDDEVDLVEAVKRMLERLGYKVVEKTGAVEALAVFREKPDKFDLLLTDLTMPEMTGFELAEEVRRIRPDLPIIFCSGFSAAVTEEKIEAYGMSNFVMKPIIKNDLARAIRSVLSSGGATAWPGIKTEGKK